MRVIVTNTALLNAGDAAIMLGSRRILRRAFGKDVSISVRDQQPEGARQRYQEFEARPLLYDRIVDWMGPARARLGVVVLLIATLLQRIGATPLVRCLLPRALHADLIDFAAADLVVSAGGTYLVPHYRFSPKLLELLVAHWLGRPYVLFPQSLGPFTSRRQRWLVRYVLGNARLIMVRDTKSLHHLRKIGIPDERVLECADAAFALQPPGPRGTALPRAPQIAISVRDWPHFGADARTGMTRYMDSVAALCTHLVEKHGAELTFVSTCQGIDAYWTDDSHTAEAVVGRLSKAVREHVTVDHEFRRPEALVERLARFDLVVATRMHVAILALTASTPVLPIAYEFKTRELFEKLGFGGLVQDIADICPDRLCGAADSMLESPGRFRQKAAAGTDALRASALDAADSLREAMRVAA
ncbi:MAG: polysaccharide pyruvyl transferase family protein [Acetobacterales bacterium]